MAKPKHMSDADTAFEAELLPDERPSRSERKRASQDLRRLGEELATLRLEQLAALPLPERLREALAEQARLSSFGARRRQALFIGKLMRQLDEESLAAVRAAVERRR